MSILIDLVAILIVVLCAWIGAKRGFIKTITGTIALILSIAASNLISRFLPDIPKDTTFLIILIVAFILLNMILSLIFKIINLAAKLPVISTINKLLGLICGIVFGVLVITAVGLYLVSSKTISLQVLNDTFVMKYVIDTATIFFGNYLLKFN